MKIEMSKMAQMKLIDAQNTNLVINSHFNPKHVFQAGVSDSIGQKYTKQPTLMSEIYD